MAVTNVDPASLLNIIITANAKPAPFFSPNSVILHLTKGFNPAGVPAFLRSGDISSAITGTAWGGTSEFSLLTPGAQALANADYGYTQLATFGRFEAIYRGKRPQMGQTDVRLGLDGQTFGDWDSRNRPWVPPNDAQRQKVEDGIITCPMQDHPNIAFPNKVINKHAAFNGSPAVVNFLQFAKYSINLIAILCEMKRSTRVLTPVQFFRWSIEWKFKVKYQRGAPKVTNMSSIDFSSPTAGDPPFGAEERKVFANPSSRLFNEEVPTALRLAFTNEAPSLRTYRSAWDSDQPKDFFR